MNENKFCEYCGGDIKIRNPMGNCDHLYYPENVNKSLRRTMIKQGERMKIEIDLAEILTDEYGNMDSLAETIKSQIVANLSKTLSLGIKEIGRAHV